MKHSIYIKYYRNCTLHYQPVHTVHVFVSTIVNFHRQIPLFVYVTYTFINVLCTCTLIVICVLLINIINCTLRICTCTLNSMYMYSLHVNPIVVATINKYNNARDIPFHLMGA